MKRKEESFSLALHSERYFPPYVSNNTHRNELVIHRHDSVLRCSWRPAVFCYSRFVVLLFLVFLSFCLLFFFVLLSDISLIISFLSCYFLAWISTATAVLAGEEEASPYGMLIWEFIVSRLYFMFLVFHSLLFLHMLHGDISGRTKRQELAVHPRVYYLNGNKYKGRVLFRGGYNAIHRAPFCSAQGHSFFYLWVDEATIGVYGLEHFKSTYFMSIGYQMFSMYLALLLCLKFNVFPKNK